ncbi:hypothetical protein THAOC_01327, partial [Thalassiosira oceanica]
EWSDRFEELTAYKAKNGDCNVPESQGRLWMWVSNRRQDFKQGKLSDERIARLKSIGFCWEPTDAAWMTRFDELAAYKDEHGDCNVPKGQGRLGIWVSNRRQDFKQGKLSDERIARLEGIGFAWDPLEQEWSDRLDKLTSYKDAHGDCNVPQSQDRLGFGSASNDNPTRKECCRTNVLRGWRALASSGINFEQEWSERFDELTAYKDEHGDCNVPAKQGPLCEWVSRQRKSCKKGTLRQERIELLESIGFEWVRMELTRKPSWKLDEQWKTRYTELVHHLINYGTCNVPHRYGPLASWVSKQRQDYKDGRISQFRIDYLNSIGFAIARIIEDEKPRHDDLSSSATEGLETRVNVGRRLAEALQEYLGNDSVRLMQTYEKPEKIDTKWQTRYTELVNHLIEHGNFDVPRKQGALRTWIYTQRRSYREGSMSQLRREYLESIGFVWTTKRIGNHWLPDQYSQPDPKAIARIIDDEKPRHEDLPSSAPESLKLRVKADRDLVKALQEYLANLENNQ